MLQIDKNEETTVDFYELNPTIKVVTETEARVSVQKNMTLALEFFDDYSSRDMTEYLVEEIANVPGADFNGLSINFGAVADLMDKRDSNFRAFYLELVKVYADLYSPEYAQMINQNWNRYYGITE